MEILNISFNKNVFGFQSVEILLEYRLFLLLKKEGRLDGKFRTTHQKIVAEQLGVNETEVKNESSFVEDLGADSLDTVELVMALEEEFECEIPDEQAEKINTVQQAIDYVNSRTN